jgi:N,N-dimethylformamidase
VEILGYTTPVVAYPGQRVEVKVSCAAPRFRARLERLAGSGGPGPFSVRGLEDATPLPGRKQPILSGSYAIAELPIELPLGRGVTFQAWVMPTRLGEARQCLMALVGGSSALELEVSAIGWHVSMISNASRESEISIVEAVVPRCWYFVAVTVDPRSGRIHLITRELGGLGPSHQESAEGALLHPLEPPRAALLAAGAGSTRPDRHFNGKIDSPRLFARALRADELDALAMDVAPREISGLCCAWRLVPLPPAGNFEARDEGPLRAHARLVNGPTRAVTGHNFDGRQLCFSDAPEQYNAAHFHEDDLIDCGWETDVSFELPADCPSGVYAVVLSCEGGSDVVPFVVSAARRLSRESPKLAVLLPTFSYLAYANEHAAWQNPIPSSDAKSQIVAEADHFVADHRLLSIYDLHSDRSGACLSSWRRPVLNFRAGYHLPLVAGPHQFSADLELLAWLEAEGLLYDVITDNDLHEVGAEALAPYRAVTSGSHPEYWSMNMLDALEAYLADGGRLAYLGGNGLYWVTSTPAECTDIIEVRRGRAGTRVWESPPGEEYHATTGERGGLWRNRGRAPQCLVGVGFTAQGFDHSLAYQWMVDANDPVAGFLAEGIDTGQPIGVEGSILGGAAGFEIDRMDGLLGTPGQTVLVARAAGFSDAYQGTVEDVLTANSRQGGTVSPLVRSDVVFVPLPGGGAVFSVGSIAWCGALGANGGKNPVARLTYNALARFLQE